MNLVKPCIKLFCFIMEFFSLIDPLYFTNSNIFHMKFVSLVFFSPSISSFGYLYYLWLWILNCHNGLDYWWHWWNFYQLHLRKCWNFFSSSIVAFLWIQSVWTIICKLPSESRGVGDMYRTCCGHVSRNNSDAKKASKREPEVAMAVRRRAAE